MPRGMKTTATMKYMVTMTEGDHTGFHAHSSCCRNLAHRIGRESSLSTAWATKCEALLAGWDMMSAL